MTMNTVSFDYISSFLKGKLGINFWIFFFLKIVQYGLFNVCVFLVKSKNIIKNIIVKNRKSIVQNIILSEIISKIN